MTLVTFFHKSDAKPIEQSKDNHKRIELDDASGIGCGILQGLLLLYDFLH